MRKLAFAVSILLAVCLVNSAHAQGDFVATPAITVDFPGGTVSEYVGTIHKSTTKANVVVMPEAEDVQIGEVSLAEADLLAAILILDGYETQTSSGSLTRLDVTLQPSSGREGQGVIVIRGEQRDLKRQAPAISTVISVADLIGKESSISAEDILSAVEAAMELTKGILTPPDIKFHKPTGLIIARGHPEQMSTIEAVVDQLRNGLRVMNQGGESRKIKELNSQFNSANRAIGQLQDELSAMKARMERRIAELEMELTQRDQEIHRLQMKNQDLQKKD